MKYHTHISKIDCPSCGRIMVVGHVEDIPVVYCMDEDCHLKEKFFERPNITLTEISNPPQKPSP